MHALIQEQIAHEQTKLELYKSQFRTLDMLGQASMLRAEALQKQLDAQQAQDKFDIAADARDMPSGQTTPPDSLRGD